MPNSAGSPSDPSPPKLTLSQRLLAALPNLQRERTNATNATNAKGAARRQPGGAANGTDEVVRPDAVMDANCSGAGATTASRLRDAFLKPPSAQGSSGTGSSRPSGSRPDPYADTSLADLKHAMKYLDDRERTFPLFIGPLIAVLDIVLTIVALHSNPAVGHKNHVAPSSILALGIGSSVIALLVMVAAFYRRRSFTIFTLLFAGYGGGFVTMIPSWFVAGWLFVRFNRMQKSVVARSGGPQRGGRGQAQRPTKPLFGRRDKTPEPTGPAANKRYTPPKPGTAGR